MILVNMLGFGYFQAIVNMRIFQELRKVRKFDTQPKLNELFVKRCMTESSEIFIFCDILTCFEN